MQEWIHLISEAKQQGFTKEELMQWLEETKKAASGKTLPKENF